MPRGPFQSAATSAPVPVVSPCWPMPPQESLQQGSFVLVPCGVTAPFLWALVHARLCLCSSFKTGVLFPPVQWKSYNQIPLAFIVRIPGIPSPFVKTPGWEAWCRVQKLCNSGRTFFVLMVSRLWVTHAVGMEFDFYHDCALPTNLLWLLLCLWM